MGAEPMARKNHAQASSIAHALIIVALMVVYMEEPVSGKASVSITNALFEPLEVHCHSADDDLGVHILSYYLQKYQFDFNPNIFGRTLFTCDFSAASKQDTSQIVWQGYSYRDPPYHCWNCNWYVLSQGFYVDGELIHKWPETSTTVAEEKVNSFFQCLLLYRFVLLSHSHRSPTMNEIPQCLLTLLHKKVLKIISVANSLNITYLAHVFLAQLMSFFMMIWVFGCTL
jgi:hypothetical protein